jgi:hypothetical protein
MFQFYPRGYAFSTTGSSGFDCLPERAFCLLEITFQQLPLANKEMGSAQLVALFVGVLIATCC